MVQEITVGADKPADDTTMNPVEMLASALGMCVAVMLRKHCEQSELACGEIQIEVTAKYEEGAGAYKNLRMRAEVHGDWDDRRRAAFQRVAEKCPVGETIVNCSRIEIEIL